MNQSTRKQVRLILDHADDLGRKAVQESIGSVISAQNKRGLSHSSMTVGEAVIFLENEGRRFVQDCIDRVTAVTKDVEAFAMLSETVLGFLQFLSSKYDEVAKLALGGRGNQARSPHFEAAYAGIWDEASARLLRQLELHRFVFTKPQSAPSATSSSYGSDTTPVAKNKAGRLPAEFWDNMWAAIGNGLYQGDLKPKRQADIEAAMTDWIEGNGHSASPSTIRARARRLWDLIQADKD